ncbi:hypothetical protein [Acidiplasma sp.]|uniref:hypothetical protein n=1 Tax=Acidiplasma sp. TaxID=1872114 RepID=UPI002582D993|nr:hypothetical protein [Acidiplasma sp.]
MMIAILVLQFFLGMYVNLFVSFNAINSLSMIMFNIPMIIMIHMMMGFLILGLSIFIFMLSVMKQNNLLSIIAFISIILVIIAGVSGIEFLFSENNIFSYSMALSFIILFLMQFIYLYKLLTIKDRQ